MNFFITNREIIHQNGVENIREDGRENAGDNLRFGTYNIDSRTFTLFPEIAQEADLLYADLDQKPIADLNGSARFFKELYNELVASKVAKTVEGKDKNDVLFFIHGFNNDLNDIRNAFKILHDKYVSNTHSTINHLVIFTWPSRSPSVPLHYKDDREDAKRSGRALARAFDKVIQFFKSYLLDQQNQPCQRNIHLMVHSMGNRVLKHMMAELKPEHHLELFREIILVGADIEWDIFENGQEYSRLIELGYRVHNYFHEKDRILDISKYTKNLFSNRLGKYGRKRPDPTLLDVFDVDVTDSKDDPKSDIIDDNGNHWYYYTSTEVVNDIVAVLNGKNTAFPRRPKKTSK
jgi:esterase/lipase superfamily enzyme